MFAVAARGWEPMATLLIEIGCEELPASACVQGVSQLPKLAEDALGCAPSQVLATPRRLIALFEDMPERTQDQWIKGPPVAMTEKAAAGFAKRHGIRVEDLEEREGYLGVEKPGQPMAEVLPEQIDAIIRGFRFWKSMRWDESGLRFARPVRWKLVMLGDLKVIGSTSYGHRFTSGAVDIPSADAYIETMRSVEVEPDQDKRLNAITRALSDFGEWSDPGKVLGEVVYLVESPLTIEGRFDERYLQLPSRVIETTIQTHVRAFPLGENRFAFVANGGDPETVRAGVENVVEGRLEDASFTFERDVKIGLDALAERLGSITFFAGGGTYADKTARLEKLVEALGGGEAALEAARLAKADQASELVREFPELEGHVGAEYARLAGYPEAVSAAIDEQYLPDGADAPLPETETGRVLSAADKIDTLNVSFGLGHRPTGSRDPYGLRRAAIGLDRLAAEGNLSIPRALMEGEVGEFVEERFEGLLDAPVEYVRAARKASVRDLGGVARLAQALVALPDDRFGPIHTAYTRASRLAEKEEGAAAQLDPALLLDPAEVEVAQALERVDPEIAAALDAGDFAAAVEAAAELGPLLDRFFEDVLVMAEDKAVRANRLRLLLNVRDTLGRLGELSQIPR
jgi:glycyl-tRNA synthetase beta chain